jgi:hypothetical protein
MQITKTSAQRRAEFDAIASEWSQAQIVLRQKPHVLDVGIGYKMVNNQLQEVMALVAYVDQKVAPEKPQDAIPPDFNGVPVDVQLMPYSIPIGTGDKRLRGGVKLNGHANAGTLGCFAYRHEDGKIVFLSSHHVLFGKDGKKNDEVYEPKRTCSLCCACGAVGRIDEGKRDGLVDAASALPQFPDIASEFNIYNKVKGLGEYKSTQSGEMLTGDDALIQGAASLKVINLANRRMVVTAIPGDRVRKVGQRTGRTIGYVIAVGSPCTVEYAQGETMNFFGQIAVKPQDASTEFARLGDSGAMLMDDHNKVVGMIMSSHENKSNPDDPIRDDTTWANNIHDVMERLGVHIPNPPVAEFSMQVTGDGKTTPFSVQLDASASVGGDGNVVEYYWNMGQTQDSGVPVIRRGQQQAYTYPLPGKDGYRIRLTVVNSIGLHASVTKTVGVIPPVTMTLAPQQPATTAAITTTERSAEAQRELTPEELLPYLKKELSASKNGRTIIKVTEKFEEEVLRLVNKNRKVTVTWQRKQGPAFIAQYFKAMRTGKPLSKEVNGIPVQSLIQSMALVLEEEGSEELAANIRKYRLGVFNALDRYDSLDRFLKALRAQEKKRKAASLKKKAAAAE